MRPAKLVTAPYLFCVKEDLYIWSSLPRSVSLCLPEGLGRSCLLQPQFNLPAPGRAPPRRSTAQDVQRNRFLPLRYPLGTHRLPHVTYLCFCPFPLHSPLLFPPPDLTLLTGTAASDFRVEDSLASELRGE